MKLKLLTIREQAVPRRQKKERKEKRGIGAGMTGGMDPRGRGAVTISPTGRNFNFLRCKHGEEVYTDGQRGCDFSKVAGRCGEADRRAEREPRGFCEVCD